MPYCVACVVHRESLGCLCVNQPQINHVRCTICTLNAKTTSSCEIIVYPVLTRIMLLPLSFRWDDNNDDDDDDDDTLIIMIMIMIMIKFTGRGPSMLRPI